MSRIIAFFFGLSLCAIGITTMVYSPEHCFAAAASVVAVVSGLFSALDTLCSIYAKFFKSAAAAGLVAPPTPPAPVPNVYYPTAAPLRMARCAPVRVPVRAPVRASDALLPLAELVSHPSVPGSKELIIEWIGEVATKFAPDQCPKQVCDHVCTVLAAELEDVWQFYWDRFGQQPRKDRIHVFMNTVYQIVKA